MTLGPTFCFDSDLRTHFQFDNPSDTLLARLSIANDVEDSILDLFLSVIHDPNFSPKEVTFKHSGDIHRKVAKLREEDMCSLGNRSSRGMLNFTIGLPNVILDGVIDVLKAELEDAILAVRSRHGIGFASLDLPASCYGDAERQRALLRAAFRTLSTCSVVHTSWLSRAQRALGSSLIRPIARTTSTPYLSKYIRNPCYSTWTRQIELRISIRDQNNIARLSSLLSRTPNVRFLQLNFTDPNIHYSQHYSRKFSDAECQMICESICSLRELEVLNLVIEHWTFPTRFFNISLPALKRICLVGLKAKGFLRVDPTANPSLNRLICLNPCLQHIVIGPVRDAKTRSSHLKTRFISWTRTTTVNSTEFSLDAMSLTSPLGQEWSLSALHQSLLSQIRQLRVCSTTVENMLTIVKAATSASSISLCPHGSVLDAALLALSALPDSVECVLIVLPRIGDGESRWSHWDGLLVGALTTTKAGRDENASKKTLRSIKLTIPPNRSAFGANHINYDELHAHLPRSKDWCEKRGVLLETMLIHPLTTISKQTIHIEGAMKSGYSFYNTAPTCRFPVQVRAYASGSHICFVGLTVGEPRKGEGRGRFTLRSTPLNLLSSALRVHLPYESGQ